MEEKRWTLPTSDGHLIYGCTTMAQSEPSPVGIILVHGLGGNMNSYHHKTTANYFAKSGYDVIRFNLYDGEPQARRMEKCTLRIHANDLNAVIDSMGASYGTLFLIGHSFGGVTVMIAQNPKIAAVSLWDPSFDLPATWRSNPELKRIGDLHVLDWGTTIIMGEDMIKEAQTDYNREQCLLISRTYGKPIQVIHAADRVNETVSWHSTGNEMNERHVVAGADHCFYNGNTLNSVHRLTEEWFARF